MRKLLSSVFLFFVLIASANDKFLVNDFESGLGGAGNAWGGVCECIIRKSKFPQNPKRSVRFSGKRTKRSVQKRKARNTQKAETKVL